MALDHPDWDLVRKDLHGPSNLALATNKRAPRTFVSFVGFLVGVWVAVLLSSPLTPSHQVGMGFLGGIFIGILLIWPKRRPTHHSHKTIKIAGGFILYVFARQMIHSAFRRRHGHEGQSPM